MRHGYGPRRGMVAAVAAVALVAMTPATSIADEDPVRDLLGSVTERARGGVGNVTGDRDGGSGGAKVTTEAPPVTSDDDSDGHETEDPKAPDHGQGTILEGGLAGNDVATVGDSKGTVEDDDSTKADATLLALGGQEIFGAHADSEGTEEEHFGDPLGPVCEGSEGQVCLRILYADAWATDDGDTSYARGQSGVADVCLGGDSSDPEADCTGPVSAGVATSEGEAERDQRSGQTTASSESDAAQVCLEDDPVTEGCAVGVGVLHSEGSSDSRSAQRESYLARLDLGGEEQGRAGDPEAISLPPGCPDAESLLCVFLNQGESHVGGSAAGHAQEALHIEVLPGNLDLVVELSRTETLTHDDGGEVRGVSSPGRLGSGGPGSPGTVAGVDAGVLPQTGGVWSGLLALALLAVGSGALLTARSRRMTASV